MRVLHQNNQSIGHAGARDGLPVVRIAICHRVVLTSDAIGHDILGMYRLLSDMGFQVAVVGEAFDTASSANMRTMHLATANSASFDLVIYHHSINWPEGEAFLRTFNGVVVFRYHNITPPVFLWPYSLAYAEECAKGIQQTARLIQHFRHAAYWIADSPFNRNQLVTFGANPDRVMVAAPFNLIADYLSPPKPHNGREVRALFIGRFLPHKAHSDLIQIVYSYLRHIDDAIVLRLVGTVDENFRAYFDELQTLVDELGIRDHVRIDVGVSHDDLAQLLRDSTVFLCCSRHEGFCVPAIEAQAAGLPLISVNASALAETLGPGQIVCDPPETSQDYLFYAYVIREITTNSELRQILITNGQRNVIRRFSPEVVENQFLASFIPALKSQR